MRTTKHSSILTGVEISDFGHLLLHTMTASTTASTWAKLLCNKSTCAGGAIAEINQSVERTCFPIAPRLLERCHLDSCRLPACKNRNKRQPKVSQPHACTYRHDMHLQGYKKLTCGIKNCKAFCDLGKQILQCTAVLAPYPHAGHSISDTSP